MNAARRLAFDCSGSGDPIVLLHGVGSSRAIWRASTKLLADDRLVVAPDLPGFGESSPPTGGGFALERAADTLGDEIARVLDCPFDLVGNSLGGALALVLAARRPELVRRLILCAPAGLAPRPWPLPSVAGMVVAPLVDLRRVVGAPLASIPAARRALLWGTVAAPEKLDAGDARMMLEASRGSRCVGSAVAAVLAADLRPRLRELRAPIGLIWGRRDRVIPLWSVRAALRERDDVPLELVAGAGHVPHLERPAEFVATLRRLLERL